MLTLTKQMKKDIRRLKEDDLVVCSDCGSEEISEKMWIDSNSYIQIDGDSYYKYVNDEGDNQYWCNKCEHMTHPIHISEYKEKNDAK